MDSFKIKNIILLISFLLISGGGIGALLYYVFPTFYPQWFPQIVLFFLIVEMIFIFAVDYGCKRMSQKALVNLYLSTKVAKILIALAFIGTYALVVKDGLKNFGLIFSLFYLLSIAFEIYYFSMIERRLKKKREKNEEFS